MRQVCLLLALILLLPAAAAAKDFRSSTAAEGGYMWIFMYDRNAKDIDLDPALTYGGTLFQLVDFSWARNMMAEVTYLYAQARGEGLEWMGDESTVFDLTMHHAAINPGYVFEGRKLHPYLSGGFGATYLIFEPLENKKIEEIDFTLNLGAGVDYTVWETGMAALERVDLGLRARYLYVFQKEIVDTAINGMAFYLRLNLRW